MARIFVGNLPGDIKEKELDDLFYKYGRIKDIDIKSPARPPSYAFITFDHYRDAEDAVRGRDGYNFDGYRLRVEFSKGDRRDRRDDRGGRDDRRTGGKRRSEYGITVENLPRGCSWQDLKDFMRKIGDVIYTDVDRNGDGTVEFSNRDDMERAVRKLDDTEFKNHDETSVIRVRYANKDRGSEDRGRGAEKSRRERSFSRSRSRDRRSRSNSGDRSPEPRRDEETTDRDRDDDRDARDDRRDDREEDR